jgi:hypothetical protein
MYNLLWLLILFFKSYISPVGYPYIQKKLDARVGVFPRLFLTRKGHGRFVAPGPDRQNI